MDPQAVSVADRNSEFAWIYRFDSTGLAHALDQPSDLCPTDGSYVWIHLNIADSRASKWIDQAADIPAEARLILAGRNEHQVLAGTEDYICGVFTDFLRELDGVGDSFCQVRFLVTRNFMITARRHPTHSARLLRDAVHAGHMKPTRPVDLFEMLLGYMLETVESQGEALLTELDEIEDHVLEGRVGDDRHRIGVLRRTSVRLHRVVNGMQRVVARFEHASKIPELTRSALQRIAQRLDSLHHDLHAVQERARLLQDEVTAQISSETNRQLYRLTILGTLIMPPTLVTGMFGMNVKGLPFADDENGYFYAMIISLLSSFIAYGIVWFTGRGTRNLES